MYFSITDVVECSVCVVSVRTVYTLIDVCSVCIDMRHLSLLVVIVRHAHGSCSWVIVRHWLCLLMSIRGGDPVDIGNAVKGFGRITVA